MMTDKQLKYFSGSSSLLFAFRNEKKIKTCPLRFAFENPKKGPQKTGFEFSHLGEQRQQASDRAKGEGRGEGELFSK